MRLDHRGTEPDMGESEHKKRQVEEHRQYKAEEVPAEEGVEPSDFDERVHEEPGEQVNRPDQPDFSEDERRQYDDPDLERSIADARWPEDR
jgi:hypothetical protein